MTVIRAKCTIPLDDALPANWVTNTWHFESDVADAPGTAQDAIDFLTAFYQAIDATVFPTTVGNSVIIDCYDLGEPEPRVPVLTDTVAIIPGSSTAFPNEVAICLSFEGESVSGLSQARRRGRVFIGIISGSSANFTASSAGIRPSVPLRDLLLNSAQTMMVPAAAPRSTRLVIYSPTIDATGTLGEATTDVVHMWVDDAWDVQRRRGPVPTARTDRFAS